MNDESEVIFFSSEYPPHVLGGLGTHIRGLTSALAGYKRIRVFVPERSGYQQLHEDVRIHQIPVSQEPGTSEYWVEFCQNAALVAGRLSGAVELIHCHDWYTALAGIKARELLEKPFVFNIHLPQRSEPELVMENLGLVTTDLLLVNSESIRTELVSRGLPIQRIDVIPNGVDTDAFHPCSDWPLDGGYVLFVGRLVHQKGIDTLLRSFGILLRRCPDSRLVIVGDGVLELYYRRVARFLGFPDRVKFIDWQTGTSLIELYQKAQVVVVPSHYEPFGIVALEAMACGRPVIASHVGGLQEIVEPGVQGYLVERGDYLDLARRLASLILDPTRRQVMGEAARAHAQSYTWDLIAKRTLVVYEGLTRRSATMRVPSTARSLWQQLIDLLDEPGRELARRMLDKGVQI